VLGAWRWGGDFVRPPGPWSMGTIGGIGVSPAPVPLCRLCFARAGQGVGRLPPFSGCFLAHQDKATGAGARELHEASYRIR
jgi:hypothetical protein